jgi:hypothetical protein
MERADLSISSASLESMEPVSAAPMVQGQSSRGDGQSKRRRRSPAAEAASEELSADDGDRPQHRIDSLA